MSDYDVEFVEVEEDLPPEGISGEVISDEDELKSVVDGLCKDYSNERAARSEKERTWAKWRRQFEARPARKRKDTPYPNASNVSPPGAQIIGQGLWAHLQGMYDAVDPPWYVEPLREGDKELIRQSAVLTKYYNILSKSRLDLNMSKVKRDFLQEVAVMGSCFMKVPWTVRPWYFKDDSGGTEREVSAMLHDGPELIVVPLEDVVYPQEWDSVQTMPWFAHDVRKAEYEIRDLVTRGVYEGEAAERVLDNPDNSSSERKRTRDDIMRSDSDYEGEFVLTEFYFYYDSDGDGLHEDLVFTVHVPTGTVLRQDYNRFGYRMISAGAFINRTFAVEGRGSGQTCEYQQDELEGIHNVRNDNMKFSNMRMLAVRRGTFRENEAIYPGKIFQTDNPREDIQPIQLGEVYPSSLQAEQQTMSYAREASGMSSVMSGFSDQTLGTRDTYRGQAMRMQKGQGLFSTIAQGLNECFSEVGMMIFFQLVKNRDRVLSNERKAKRLNEEELAVLGSVLSVRFEEIPQKLAFHIRTSDVDETYEAKRQNMLSLTQLFAQYAQQVTPLAMQLFGPQGQQMMQSAPEAYRYLLSIYNGSTKLMAEVFKFFGEEDPQKFVPDNRKQEMLQEFLEQMSMQMVGALGAAQGAPAGPVGPAGPMGPGGMPMNGSGPAPGQGMGAGGPAQGGGGSGGMSGSQGAEQGGEM